MKTERFFGVIKKVNAIVLLLAGLVFLGLMLNSAKEEWDRSGGWPEFGSSDRGSGSRGETKAVRDSLLTFDNFMAVPGTSWARAAIREPVYREIGGGIHIDRKIVNYLFINSETGVSRRLLPHDEAVFLEPRSYDLEYFGWEDGPSPLMVFSLYSPVGKGTNTKGNSDSVDLAISRLDGSGFKTLVSGKGHLGLVRMNPVGNVVFHYVTGGELLILEVDPVSLEIRNNHQVNLGPIVGG